MELMLEAGGALLSIGFPLLLWAVIVQSLAVLRGPAARARVPWGEDARLLAGFTLAFLVVVWLLARYPQ